MSLDAWHSWQDSPVLTTVGTTAHPIYKIDFPAITICSQGLVQQVIDNALVKQFNDYLAKKGIDYKTLSPSDLKIEQQKYAKDLYPGASASPQGMVNMLVAKEPSKSIKSSALTNPEFLEDSIPTTTTASTTTAKGKTTTVAKGKTTTPKATTPKATTPKATTTTPKATTTTPKATTTTPKATTTTPKATTTTPKAITTTPYIATTITTTSTTTTMPVCKCTTPFIDPVQTREALGLSESRCVANFGLGPGKDYATCSDHDYMSDELSFGMTYAQYPYDGAFIKSIITKGIQLTPQE